MCFTECGGCTGSTNARRYDGRMLECNRVIPIYIKVLETYRLLCDEVRTKALYDQAYLQHR